MIGSFLGSDYWVSEQNHGASSFALLKVTTEPTIKESAFVIAWKFATDCKTTFPLAFMVSTLNIVVLVGSHTTYFELSFSA